ncbi:MAG: LysR family transcriptional regulator [Alphaproteobacteria bacterium]|nr:LysR family transcriptional regulator [Alphaproteobacteria bacterium]
MLDALTLDQIRVFVAVAEAGSFRQGARRLSRVQSAISHAIANLEAELGVTLFDRSGHKPVLTRAGTALLEDSRAILLKADSLRARARGLGEGVELSLSLCVDVLYSLPAISDALYRMREMYPSVAIRLETAALGGPLTSLLNGRCQIAITAGEEFRDPHVTLEALRPVVFVAVAAPMHPLARRGAGVSLDAADLVDHLQIVQEDPTAWSEGRDIGVLSPSTWRVAGQDSKHALIRAGLGWGRLPLWAAEEDLESGRLVRLNAVALGLNGASIMGCYLAHRNDAPLGPAARTLRQILLTKDDRESGG